LDASGEKGEATRAIDAGRARINAARDALTKAKTDMDPASQALIKAAKLGGEQEEKAIKKFNEAQGNLVKADQDLTAAQDNFTATEAANKERARLAEVELRRAEKQSETALLNRDLETAAHKDQLPTTPTAPATTPPAPAAPKSSSVPAPVDDRPKNKDGTVTTKINGVTVQKMENGQWVAKAEKTYVFDANKGFYVSQGSSTESFVPTPVAEPTPAADPSPSAAPVAASVATSASVSTSTVGGTPTRGSTCVGGSCGYSTVPVRQIPPSYPVQIYSNRKPVRSSGRRR